MLNSSNEPLPPTICLEVGDFSVNTLKFFVKVLFKIPAYSAVEIKPVIVQLSSVS